MEHLLLRPTEVAEVIGLSRSATYQLLSRGELPFVRIGNSVRVPVDALRAWVARQTNVAIRSDRNPQRQIAADTQRVAENTGDDEKVAVPSALSQEVIPPVE